MKENKNRESLLSDVAKRKINVYSPRNFPFLENKIIYIEDKYNEALNKFILDNLDWLEQKVKDKGCSFIYFPKLLNSGNVTEFISEYLLYHYPQITGVNKLQLENEDYKAAFWTKALLELLNLPEFKTPALLLNRGLNNGTNQNEYSCYALDTDDDLTIQFEGYFENIQPANATSDIQVRLVDDLEEYRNLEYEDLIDIESLTADELFEENANQLTDDVIQKIEYLKKNEEYSLLAEVALRLFDGNKTKLLKHIDFSGIVNTEIKTEPGRLIVEWDTKYNFQIILPDYGNRIVKMPRLPKALYYFFLRHPEGVMLNNLAHYKEELFFIYNRISNLSDKREIRQNIERLVDPLDNSVNVNCSRIKNAFVKLIDDELARNYYITGKRGEPKRVILPKSKIQIINY